jgi:phenylacetate 2-hydroxylase
MSSMGDKQPLSIMTLIQPYLPKGWNMGKGDVFLFAFIALLLYTAFYVSVLSSLQSSSNALQYISEDDIPFIDGIPEIPHGETVLGHLRQLGDDHATACERWWRKYKVSVFQIRLGTTRAVVVNSFEDAKRMLIGNQSAVIDRPTLYTFHGIISSTQGFTIGSSPWDESCKNKRKAAGQALGRPKIKDYYDMFDLESYCIVRDLAKDSGNGEKEISVRPYIQRYALNTTLTLCYGIRMDSVEDSMLQEILEVGSAISLLRSASENYQDYVPIMRYWPRNRKNRRSRELRDRRDKYLNSLLDQVREMIDKGTDKPCISAAILKDEETKLTDVEVSSICLSLVSGGFETIPGTLTSCIGSLSTAEGQKFQEKAYRDIKSMYPNVRDAWRNSFQDEKVPYVNAIIKEALRYYTVSAMSLPRKTIEPVQWGESTIPAKTMILINAQAANHGTFKHNLSISKSTKLTSSQMLATSAPQQPNSTQNAG